MYANKHPKDTSEGAIVWGRETPYLVGDRVRHTVVLVLADRIWEMTPDYAREFAKEILTHADDVGAVSASPSQERP